MAAVHPELKILHVDMDAFYASVEERDDPSLKGKPVIVGGANARGVVSTCNYIARRYGVHSAMPGVTAKRLCPDGIFLPSRMSHYAEIAKQIRAVFNRFTPLVEPLSLDEAFLDIGGSRKLHGNAIEIASAIRKGIKDDTELTASVGVASNKFLAKLASDLDKPLPVRRLWGVGKVSGARLQSAGIHTVADIRTRGEQAMIELFGERSGKHLSRLARGQDERPVVPDHDAKSISHETTFSDDVVDIDTLRGVLLSLTEDVARRVRRVDARARTVQIKVRHGDFKTVTRAHTLPAPDMTTDVFYRAAKELLETYLGDRKFAIRLLGMGVTGFGDSDAAQGDLFSEIESQTESAEIDSLSDKISDKFGKGAITRAGALRRRNTHER